MDSSNEHGIIEQNEEHLVMNISIYHARKTEQYAMRYAMKNRAKHIGKIFQGLREITKSLKSELLRDLLCMVVLVTTEITKIHGIHLCKNGMAYNKTHVELMPIRCTK